MKHEKKRPCGECPFYNDSLPGWLGNDSPQAVIDAVNSEGGYACHMSIDRVIRKGGGVIHNGKLCANVDEVQQCVGAILCATKSFKLYRKGPLRSQQDCLDRLDEDRSNILDTWEFLKYHAKGKS